MSRCVLVFSVSICAPMVLISLHRHSTSSVLGDSTLPSSLTMHSCMMRSVSIFFLYSCPMNWMLPSMRRRALRSSLYFLTSSIFFCLASSTISPSSPSAPSFPLSSPPSSSPPLASLSFCSFSHTAFMAASPRSNSSWHLLSSTRLKVTSRPLAGSGNLGNRSLTYSHRLAYISQKVVSVRALSKIWSMKPTSVLASLTSTWRIFSASRSKLSGVSLLRWLL
mmetsp:Transcript_13186/g.37153  ORF Transcript_13186/g.37153 Transcript_13186/m.37153 type:complete len:222 (-) Transcript_13186:1867-2532(-)